MTPEDYQIALDGLRRDWGGVAVDPQQPGILRATNDPTTGILVGVRAPVVAEIINRALTVLTRSEHHLLDWLSKEDHSAYGECQGRDYDRLESLGLVQLVHRDARGGGFNRVGLTDKGRELQQQLGEWQQ